MSCVTCNAIRQDLRQKITAAQYIPPSRFMHFDLIIFDEASQQSQKMLRQVRVALSESSLGPFVIFVGDAYDVLPL